MQLFNTFLSSAHLWQNMSNCLFYGVLVFTLFVLLFNNCWSFLLCMYLGFKWTSKTILAPELVLHVQKYLHARSSHSYVLVNLFPLCCYNEFHSSVWLPSRCWIEEAPVHQIIPKVFSGVKVRVKFNTP